MIRTAGVVASFSFSWLKRLRAPHGALFFGRLVYFILEVDFLPSYFFSIAA